ncbi:MAG: glycosidase, partial [Candidatus Harrisonbacteria bacterium]|nr:glycosidase [Candidatus Harrisonbacteria bacterium]
QSEDGETITYRHPEPIYLPREPFEQKKDGGNSGCEDPRISRIGNTLYMCYTAYDGVHVPRVAVSSISVRDFVRRAWNWSNPVLITPGEVDDKDACLLPEKVGGNYVILHRVASHICADISPSLDFQPEQVNKCFEVLEPRRGMWDGTKVGVGAPPIQTKAGWLLLYHGVSNHSVYRVGATLLDLEDPTTVIARTADPIFEPQEEYEMKGEIPRVVFPCGAIVRDDTIFLYYGGADHVVGVAKLSLSKTLKALS